VVASALPETQRLIDDFGVGWCVPPDDPRALAAALHEALNRQGDPALAERLTRARSELRWSRERGRLLALYAALDR
jgi:glycosyltransferase involved in cell wall biosynthesis